MTCQELADDLNELLYGRNFQENEHYRLVRSRVVREDIRGIDELTGGAVEVLSHQRADSRYRYRNERISLYNHSLNVEEGSIVREGLERLGLLAYSEGMNFLLQSDNGEKGLLELIRQCFFPEDDGLKDVLGSEKPMILPERQKETNEVLQWMKELHAAIMGQAVLFIEKRDFDGTIWSFQFHPYVLKQYNSRWWVFGYDPMYPGDEKPPALFRKVRLDKIISLKRWDPSLLPEHSLKDAYHPSPIVAWEDDWFGDMIGVSWNHGSIYSTQLAKEDVYLAFSPQQNEYEQSRPLHWDQKPQPRSITIGEEQWPIYKLTLSVNYEFYKKVAELRDQVVILYPESIRTEAKRVATNLISYYGSEIVEHWTPS